MTTGEHLFCGLHVLGEMYGIEPKLLDDAERLEAILSKGIDASGATLCGTQIKKFEPSGVTILALLSESHASIHTYPDQGALFFDAFTCGDRCRTEAIAEELIKALKPTRHELSKVLRGDREGFSEDIPASVESSSIEISSDDFAIS